MNKTKSLDAEKDRLLKIASDANDLKIAQAKGEAATANQKAQEANDAAATVEQTNLTLQAQVLTLQGKVSSETGRATTAESGLAKANKETSDFAHSLQQQQATMQQQAKVSPQLTPFQQQQLANVLRPFAGQEVIIHDTTDTVVARLASSIAGSFNLAGLKVPQFTTDMGALYEGVSVAVHDPNNVPALAISLVNGLRQAGIDAHPVAAPQQVPEGKVALYLGPN